MIDGNFYIDENCPECDGVGVIELWHGINIKHWDELNPGFQPIKWNIMMPYPDEYILCDCVKRII